MSIKQSKPNILENADFKQWFNSEIFAKCLMSECKGKLNIEQINTLSFMFASIFAMKARDYVSYVSSKNPGEIEEYASRCAKNIKAYLLNFPVIKKDWLELFLIGYSGESVLIDSEEQNIAVNIDNNVDDQEDEYAKSALIYTMSLDPNLTEPQELEVIKLFVQKVNSKKKSGSSKADKSNVKIVRRFLRSVSKKQKYPKQAASFKMRAVEYVFRGGVSATLLIVGTKLIPFLGVMAPIALSLAGYAFSPKVLDLALEVKLWRKKNDNYNIPSQVRSAPKIKKVSGEVDFHEVDSLMSLKKKISEDVRAQKRTMMEFEAKASQIESAEAKLAPSKERDVVRQLGLYDINSPYDDMDEIDGISSDLKSKKMILRGDSVKESSLTHKHLQTKKSIDKTFN